MNKIEKWVDHGDGQVTIHLIQEDGTKFYNFYMKDKTVCQHCQKTGHTFPNCPAKAQGKSPASCIKCEQYWHRAEFCPKAQVKPSMFFIKQDEMVEPEEEPAVHLLGH